MEKKIIRKALLLAGGYGTRLRPITDAIPKCLVTIGGRPLLSYWLNLLLNNESKYKIEKVLINNHYLSEKVENYIRNSIWRDQVDIIYEENLLGTAGTLRKNTEYFNNEPFIVAHADNLSFFSLTDFVKQFISRPDECIGTMMTFNTDNPSECGIVDLNKKGIMIGYHEKIIKPPTNLANAATFIFDNQIFKVIQENFLDNDLCGQIIPRLNGKLNTYKNNIYHRDIGNIQSHQKAEIEILNLKIKYNV